MIRIAALGLLITTAAAASPQLPALGKLTYGSCSWGLGNGPRTPASIKRAVAAGSAGRWAEAAAAYEQAARAYHVPRSDPEFQRIAKERYLLYVNAVLAWLNAGRKDRAQTLLADAQQHDLELEEDLRAALEKLPAPPSCFRLSEQPARVPRPPQPPGPDSASPSLAPPGS